jgi:hypothetical protein
MIKLSSLTNQEFNFLRISQEDEPTWFSGMKLVSWESLQSHASQFKRVYEAAEVYWLKNTHIRLQGIDRAHFRGAPHESIRQLSKHTPDKLSGAYMPELPPDTMHVNAGFSMRRGFEEEYFVPRALLNLDEFGDADERTALIFGKVTEWREQAASRIGDKSKAAENFLNKTLPFLATVAIQDGIHWVNDFPQHAVTLYLVRVLGERYLTWASNARNEVERMTQDLQARQITSLNLSTQAAFQSVLQGSMQDRVVMNEIRQSVEQTRAEIAQQAAVALQNSYRGVMGDQLHPLFRTQASLAAVRVPAARSIPEEPQQLTDTNTTAVPPTLPKDLPRTLRQLVDYHLQFNLERFQDDAAAKKKYWDKAMQMAFSRRDYLFKYVQKNPILFDHQVRHEQISSGKLQTP